MLINKIIMILIIILFSFVFPPCNVSIKADEISINNIQKDIDVNKIDNGFLMNNGGRIIEKDEIFKVNIKDFGSDPNFITSHDSGYILVTEKTIHPLPKNTPGHLSRYKIKIIKISKSGKIEWSKTYGYKGMNRNNCRKIIKTSDGGYMILGEVSKGLSSEDKKEMLLVKIDSVGKVEWERIWGVEKSETGSLYGVNVNEVEDGYIVINTNTWGAQYSEDKEHCYIIKIRKDGTQVWKRDLDIIKDFYIYQANLINDELNLILKQGRNNLIYIILDKDNGDIIKILKYNISKKYGELSLYNGYIVDNKDNCKIISGDILNIKKASIGIYVMVIDNDYNIKWFKIYWNDNNNCNYKGIVGNSECNFIIYGNIDYKIKGYGKEIFLIKIEKKGMDIYTRIFNVGNNYSEVKRMEINDKGELIGLFEWSTNENGEYKSYISIEKIIVK